MVGFGDGTTGSRVGACELDRQDVEIGIRWRYIDEVKACKSHRLLADAQSVG